MSNNIEYKKDPHNGKVIAGVILLVVGTALLFRQLDIFFLPGWLFSWPMWLIIPGLYIGAKSNFQKPTWFILVLLGLAFMAKEAFHVSNGIIWPLVFIVFGIWMIVRRNNKQTPGHFRNFDDGRKSPLPADITEPVIDYRIKDMPLEEPIADATPPVPPKSWRPGYNDDYIDVVAVFGGVDRIIMSKDFKGGEIVNILGGTEIDFTKADIKGHVVIEITQICGGTKLIVPPHWHVVSDIASVFAGVDDKRMRHSHPVDTEKVLIIKGVSIFAGINIRSY